MPELPSCLCVRGLPPYDRLTAIYQAAAELSGDESLPDPLCVAAEPPFSRFSYIYEAFRALAGDDDLPSRICVAGEAPADQVSRIYQAVLIYADDADLLPYRCVRGMPIWQQWVEIYRALYSAAGSEDLLNPRCANIASLDVLSEVFCALVGQQGGATLLASFYIPEIVDTFERIVAAGYTGNGDANPFQREAAVDVLRDAHYQSGGPYVLLEDSPTPCSIIMLPATVTPGSLEFSASYAAAAVSVSVLRYEYQVDSGSAVSNGTNLTLSNIVATAGTHTLSIRAVSTSGVEGPWAVSAPFNVSGPVVLTWSDAVDISATNSYAANGPFESIRQSVVNSTTGNCSKIRVGATFFNSTGSVKVALYDSSNNLLGQGTTAYVIGTSGTWLEVSLASPVAVNAATTYHLGFAFNNAGVSYGILTGSGASLEDFVVVYAGFPIDPWPAADNTGQTYAVGMGVS